MKVLLLGGTGVFGKSIAALLTRESLVTEIGLASRRLEAAQRAAAEIGGKARPVCVDIQDLTRLSSIAGDYNIIVNAAGPTSAVQVPALRAAIEADVHYCDLGVLGNMAIKALDFDRQAQAKGVTAIIGTGWCAVTSLMAVHAARQLDQTEDLFMGYGFDYSPEGFFSPEKFLARVRQQGYVETSAVDLMEGAGSSPLVYRAGRWIGVEPAQDPIEVVHPSGYRITAYPMDAVETVTLPRYLPGVKRIATLLSLIPPRLNELYHQHSQRVAKGEIDPAGAVVAFYETALADKGYWLSSPPGYPSGWWMWATVAGYNGGRKARYMCYPAFLLDWTSVSLVIVALSILRGDVSMYGVLPPVACFELKPFFREAAKYVREGQRGKPLLNERFEWLE